MATIAPTRRPHHSRAGRSGRTATAVAARRSPSPRELLASALKAPLSDYYLVLGASVMLVLVGTLMVLSASSVFAYVSTSDAYYFAKRQAFFLPIGAALAWWLSTRPLKMLRALGWAGLILAVLLLVATFIPGLGVEVGGNRNWLRLPGNMVLQPSEFAKLALIVWSADILQRRQKRLDEPRQLLSPFLPAAILMVALVVLQGDLGTAMVMMMIVFAVLWVVGTPVGVLAAMLGAGVAAVGLLVLTSPNRMHRILGFLNPDVGQDAVNHQSLQSMYALASGGWWGRGLGKSRAKYGALPESHTDFVFAVLGEEMGLFGTLIVVFLFAVLGFAGLRIALRSDSLFTKITSAGITLWFLLQAIVNIAVVLRMLPVLGVPLPFVSYGGSALLANLIALGFLLACARHEPQARRAIARSKGRLPRLSTIVDGGRA